MITENNATIQEVYNLIQNSNSWNWSTFGQSIEAIINTFIGFILIILLPLLLIRYIEKKLKVDKINYIGENFINFIIEIIPHKFTKHMLSKLFDIQAKTFILLPKATIKNYKHLGYQLNGLNRFLEEHPESNKQIKIILINNSTLSTTKKDISQFLEYLSKNRRYIIIATMSDIFDSLLKNIDNKFNDDSYKKMIRVIGTLASQSERYKNYEKDEKNENVIRLSPPDFDEAKKATSNIISKIISSFCPDKGCKCHKKNNIILISSNSYGDAVKKSFSTLFAEYKEEFDTSTNIHIEAKDLNKGIYRFTYHYDIEKGIVVDTDTDDSFDALLNKMNKAINTIFIIGYEPNISNILKQIDEHIKKREFNDSEFSILISATASVREWRESIIETVNNLDIKENIDEINFIKIQYPEFKADNIYDSRTIHFKLYELNHNCSKNNDLLKECDLEFNKEEIEEIVYKPKMNYINGFIYMSLEFIRPISKEWDINLLSLKEELFHKKDTNGRDITGVKILKNGDSINHFKVKKLKWKKD